MKDPRERHLVCKLDRYQLEDKYLRLLDEIQDLKKLTNTQEDKIKKLATKLLRVSANPKSCVAALDVINDKDKIASLEGENIKLKEKIGVLRNQLLSHGFAKRPSSTGRRPPGTSSGATTCRSETSRLKVPSCHCTPHNGNDPTGKQDYAGKLKEMEMQKKEMLSRIAELEGELASYMADNHREKVAENVEYIRVWRQMKQCNEKLITTQTTNESLNEEIRELKRILEEANQNNREITAALFVDKKRMTEMEEKLLEAKDSQESLREKNERIRELLQEMKVLQKHNNELIALNSKYNQVEMENMDLKRKISEQSLNHQSLKCAFNNEQTNVAALQNANEQLLGKLYDLQRNIDILTMQLMTFQREKPQETQSYKIFSPSVVDGHQEHVKPSDSAQEVSCRKVCSSEKSIQTCTRWNSKEEACQTDDRFVCPKQDVNISNRGVEKTPLRSGLNGRVDVHSTNPLSRERILMLLEQTQINSPLDSHRIRHISDTIDMECSEIDSRQRQVTNIEKILLGDTSYF